MTIDQVTTPEGWLNYNTNSPIAACRLNIGDLKKLYKILAEKQKEYRDKVLVTLAKSEKETDQEFEERKTRVKNAFVISVTITGNNEQTFTGNREDLFDSPNVPSSIRSVFYSSQSVPNAVLNHLPQDRVTIFLDFSRRPLLDFERLPTLPTPNESNFQIAANSESWFTSTRARLSDFFLERKSGFNWLHRSGVYDVFLYFLGFPFAIWGACKLNLAFPGISSLPTFLSVLIDVYTFVIFLILFRILFSYSRWVFPKIELSTEIGAGPLKHRAIWFVILTGSVSGFLTDLIKMIFK